VSVWRLDTPLSSGDVEFLASAGVSSALPEPSRTLTSPLREVRTNAEVS
jgi:hypothetical protein